MKESKIQAPVLTGEQRERLIKWVEALESDKYEQTTDCLHKSNDGFCCLGVACEVYKAETGLGEWLATSERFEGDDDYEDFEPLEFHIVPRPGALYSDGSGFQYSHSTALPLAVADWFGVVDPDPALRKGHDEVRNASGWNDSVGKNFKEIAALIRETYAL